MAKVVAPFKISGTLDDLNFIITSEGKNFVRMKGKTGVSKEEFKNNPIFDPIRNHGKEWGYCSKKAQNFRQMAVQLFQKAKDGSFAGRSIKLMSEILNEDTVNPKGQRTLEQGLESENLPEIVIGFEGNRNRPLNKILKYNFEYCTEKNIVKLPDFTPENHLLWPLEEATHVQLQMATAYWNPKNETFQTTYSDEITLEKNQETNLQLTTKLLEGNCWKITFLYIGFAVLERRKLKPLHRKHNTVTLIACHK